MKKIQIFRALMLGGLVMLVIGLSGCGSQKVDQLKETSNNIKNIKNEVQNTANELSNKVDNKKGLVGNMKEAIKNGVAMKCTATEGKNRTVTYIKGKDMRTSTISSGKTMNILIKGGVTYTWVEGETKGQKMAKNCMEDMQKEMGITDDFMKGDNPSIEDTKDVVDEVDAGKLDCSPSTGGDFSIPKNVQFADQCEIFKKSVSGLKKQMENMPNMPSANK